MKLMFHGTRGNKTITFGEKIIKGTIMRLNVWVLWEWDKKTKKMMT